MTIKEAVTEARNRLDRFTVNNRAVVKQEKTKTKAGILYQLKSRENEILYSVSIMVVGPNQYEVRE